MVKPGVTLTMIVKNEEKKLPRCLNSVKGAVDAIAIVDTGSTDATLKIANAAGAKTQQIEWPGAFDEARNASLALVETEWVLWLDADEWLPPASIPNLKAAVKRDDAFCFNLILKEIGHEGEQVEVRMPRLWRSRPPVPFVGVVHEHLDRDVLIASGETRKEYDTEIVIHHDGYAGGATSAKYEKYIPMLVEELGRRPGQIYYEVKLACTLAAAKKPEAGAELAKLADRLLAEQDKDEQDVIVASAIGPILDAVSEPHLRTPRTDALLRLARGWFPETPVVAWHAAQLHVRRGDLKAALDALLDLERMAETGRFDRRTPYLVPILGPALWTNLGIVAHQLGRKDVARRNYERLLELDPAHPVAKQNLALL